MWHVFLVHVSFNSCSFKVQSGLTVSSIHDLEWASTINSSSEFLLSFNQDFYFVLSPLTVAWAADFTGQGTLQKTSISFLKLMSSQASYKLFRQTLTLSQFLPAWIVWVCAQQKKRTFNRVQIHYSPKWVMFHSS